MKPTNARRARWGRSVLAGKGRSRAGRRQVSQEQDVGEGEPQEGQCDPRHVDQGLLDRDESESPEQDEEQQRGVDGPIAAESILGRRHIRESFTFDKKLRASIAGGAVESASKRLHRRWSKETFTLTRDTRLESQAPPP